jgi:DUF438 domain-containing protein
MQCRCRKIIITRRVVDNITDPVMRTICQKLMQGGTLKRVRKELDLHVTVFNMFIGEIKRLLLEAGLKVHGT